MAQATSFIEQMLGQAVDDGVTIQPTADERTALLESLADIEASYRCNWTQHMRIRRGIDRGDIGTIVDSPKMSSFEFLSAMRSTQILNTEAVLSLHKFLTKLIVGATKHGEKEKTPITKPELDSIFFDTLKIILSSLPPAATYAGRLTLGVGVELRPQIMSEIRLKSLKDQLLKQNEILTATLAKIQANQGSTNNTPNNNKRSATAEQDNAPPTKIRRTGGPPNKKVFLCEDWLRGKCSNRNCQNSHSGNLRTILFVNDLKKIGLSNEKCMELASPK